jgi:hypothetical protein
MQGTEREADSGTVYEIRCLSWNPETHCVNKSPPPEFVLSQLSPVDTLTSILFRMPFWRYSVTCLQGSRALSWHFFEYALLSCFLWSEIDTGRKLKIRAFWDVVPCKGEVHRRFEVAYCLHHQGDNGGSTYLWNVGLLRDYTALHPRRLKSSYSQPWEHEISHGIKLFARI